MLGLKYSRIRSDRILLGSCGFHGDVLTVMKNIKAQMKVINNILVYTAYTLVYYILAMFSQMYEHEHHKPMSCGAVAQLVATMFYHRRFFPYYTNTVIVGLDPEGMCYHTVAVLVILHV